VSRSRAYAAVIAAAALPRLVVLLHERGKITSANVDKGDVFARTFLSHGTYGFIPGHPSAYTQPLYGFFLVPLYWVIGRSWIVVGAAHIVIAAATAIVVYETGRRFVSARVGVIAAIAATLEPYLVWHDVHMNREILDEALAAALTFLVLWAASRASAVRGLALGVVVGAAILGNVRLLLLPLLLAVFIVAKHFRAGIVPALAVIVGAVVVLTPWVVRNRVSVGCTTITTDGRALWKANNPATLRTLERGDWIDKVPPVPGAPPTPQDAGAIYRNTGRVVATDECAQMRFYRRRAIRFMVHNPIEKAKLSALAARMLWQPSVTRTSDRPGEGTFVDVARTWVEAAYMIVLYGLGLFGLRLLPRRVAALALLLLVYATATAAVFAGETRYRVPWDFLIAFAAGAALARLAAHASRREALVNARLRAR
jgi:hypothetical protein